MRRYKKTGDEFHHHILSKDSFYDKNIFDEMNYIEHTLSVGERLDFLAHKYFGAEDLWYIIALCNNIVNPFSLKIGTTLRIPTDVKFILDRI